VFGYLLEHVLTPSVVASITARVVEIAREEADGERRGAVSVEALEAELANLRAEQKRCAKLLARLDDAPEVEAEYKARTAQVRQLEAAIAAAKAAPVAAGLAAESMAAQVAGAFDRLRDGLSGAPDAARDAIRALFPTGLRFAPGAGGKGWDISGAPVVELGAGAIGAAETIGSDPTGT
jgi:hypothetical protein